ncbi:hypothetical protein L2X99_09360 [Microbacterium sp. KUDC0406]|uniref:hypothetical protein n=1 Tax=Microbacterium sp. KUDC0406 TaxID=2909588 RepID=UPI001F43F5C8|nr:hypothetical protein [Microbacterium sp. KUDC0406]UJP08729.1 hypothetical protein L2X99_09360 [Microbacterium sp. KUDC0406]
MSAIGAVLSLFRILPFDFSPATSLGTLVGLTAIGLGIAAAVSRRGRRAGIFGIVTALAGALVWGLV